MVHQRTHGRRPSVTAHHSTFRCVAIYNSDLDRWHRYVTNMPVDIMRAAHLPAVYAARWEVELVFRELKTHYRLDQLPSANKHIVEVLIYAAILALLASRALYRALFNRGRINKTGYPSTDGLLSSQVRQASC